MNHRSIASLESLEPRRLFATVFAQTNLVSDGFVSAAHTDSALKNPWGVSFLPSGPFWISDNGTSKTTVYDAGRMPMMFAGAPKPPAL